MNRGVVYLVWGEKIEPLLERSIASVRRFYPDIAIYIYRCDPDKGLEQKTKLASSNLFDTTLYLDADTVVTGNLDAGFTAAERHGLALTLCGCPWLRRYGDDQDDLEYSTGVLFFTRRVSYLFQMWAHLSSRTPSASRWIGPDGIERGLAYEDQASFSRAVRGSNFNPYVLPLNYNFRPEIQKAFFAPLKVWHSAEPVPEWIETTSRLVETGKQPVTFCRCAE